jgi:undecaprenyl-diphosphatase
MALDVFWTQLINSFAGRWEILDWIMIALTKGGVELLVAMIALRWWAKRNRPAARYVAISCGFGTALGLLFNQAILLFVHRPRPYDLGLTHLLIDRSQDPSFPSDHATVVFAIAFSLMAKRDRYTGVFLLAGLLVSVSRVYVGTHYVTDVLGGAATAALATLLIAAFYREESRLNQRLVSIL